MYRVGWSRNTKQWLIKDENSIGTRKSAHLKEELIMPRVKGGTVTRRRRKRILKLAKGYYGAKHLLFKTAKQQVMKSYMYAYRDRRQKKRDFRKLWITRINAAARLNGLSYSVLMNGLKKAEVAVNRKMLADLAVNDPAAFTVLADTAKKALS